MGKTLDFEPTNEDILILKEWIEKTPHIRQDIDDYDLAAVIRAAKGSVQKAKILLEKFHGLGHRFPNLFGHLDPSDIITQAYLNATYVFPLPQKTNDGSTVYVHVARNDADVDFTNFNLCEIHRFWKMSLFTTLWEKMDGNAKIILIYDCSTEQIARLKGTTPSFVRDSMQILDAFPIRLQAIHFINVPSFVEPIINFAKSLTKSKMAKRFHFHSNLEGLYKKIPRKILPKEYGGCEESVRTLHDLWRKKIEGYRDRLIETSEGMRKLDPLRPKIEKHDQELKGTFRTLLID